MSLSVIPLTILGQITGVTGSGETALYQVSFKSIDGTPLYGVTAVWTDEQAEIEALAAQKPYGVWINPINGTFTVKFAGYTYVGNANLTDPDVLAGITPIEFANQNGGGGGAKTIIYVSQSDLMNYSSGSVHGYKDIGLEQDFESNSINIESDIVVYSINNNSPTVSFTPIANVPDSITGGGKCYIILMGETITMIPIDYTYRSS